MGSNFDACTPLSRADLKASAVVGKRVNSFCVGHVVWIMFREHFILKPDRHEKSFLTDGRNIVSILYLLQIKLVPLTERIWGCIAVIGVLDAVTEGIPGLCELPGKN